MHRISIKNETENDVRPTYVFIDGQRIRAVSVNFSQSVDTIPTCEIEIRALPDIEALADIQFSFTPKTIAEASEIITHTLTTDEAMYCALVSSICSVLRETPADSDPYDAAEAIANRIIGEE